VRTNFCHPTEFSSLVLLAELPARGSRREKIFSGSILNCRSNNSGFYSFLFLCYSLILNWDVCKVYDHGENQGRQSAGDKSHSTSSPSLSYFRIGRGCCGGWSAGEDWLAGSFNFPFWGKAPSCISSRKLTKARADGERSRF
jgi:hypothetical protein